MDYTDGGADTCVDCFMCTVPERSSGGADVSPLDLVDLRDSRVACGTHSACAIEEDADLDPPFDEANARQQLAALRALLHVVRGEVASLRIDVRALQTERASQPRPADSAAAAAAVPAAAPATAADDDDEHRSIASDL